MKRFRIAILPGECCYLTQCHFIDRLLDGQPFETDGQDDLKTLIVREAVYRAADQGRPAEVSS